MTVDPGEPSSQRSGRVYVLRVWHEPGDGGAARYWRASLRGGTGGSRRHFASVDDGTDHLYSELLRR